VVGRPEPAFIAGAVAAITRKPVILVDGALQYRAFDQGMAQLADLLSPHFTVIHYNRRGRGDSTDTLPFALEREIEDVEAVIDRARRKRG